MFDSITYPVRVITADPPWSFGDKLPGGGRGSSKHYDVLTVEDIMRFPLPRFADDAILFLWRVSSQVEEAYRVCRAWGFTPKTEIVWVKTLADDDAAADDLEGEMNTKIGMGHYARNVHETCILATRGRFKVADRGVRTVFRAPLGKHSEKPAAFYDLVSRLVGIDKGAPPVELFGRVPRAGWNVFGNELEGGRAVAAPAIGNVPASTPPIPDPFAVEVDEDGNPKMGISDEDRAHLARAVAEGLIPAELVEKDPGEAWIKLQYKAPGGWFDRDLKPENLSELAYALEKRGVSIPLPSLAKLTALQRAVAQSWTEQPDTDRPDFLARWAKAAAVEGCIACSRGEAYTEETAFKHTGQGATCKASVPAAEETPAKRKPGRPKKNAERIEDQKAAFSNGTNGTNGTTPHKNGASNGAAVGAWVRAEQLSAAHREDLPDSEKWIDA